MISPKLFSLTWWASSVRHCPKVLKFCGICPDPMEKIRCFTIACICIKKAASNHPVNPMMKFLSDNQKKRSKATGVEHTVFSHS